MKLSRSSLQTLLSPDYMAKKILEVHRFARGEVMRNPERAFDLYFVKTADGKAKPLAYVDLQAERFFRRRVELDFGTEYVRVEGEEHLNEGLNLEGERRVCLLVDMLDGTDLFQKGFSNWCSAVVVFDPQQVKILGAFVATPSRRGDYLYYATSLKPLAHKVKLNQDKKKVIKITSNKLPKPSSDKKLEDASICLYAQKADRFRRLLEIGTKTKFVDWLKKVSERDRRLKARMEGELKFRFYDLAGSPMMVRIPEGIVDIVFDLGGQAPHDVVAGAFIALQAGAVISKPDGSSLTLEEISQNLLHPGASKIRYALAANKKMLNQFTKLIA